MLRCFLAKVDGWMMESIEGMGLGEKGKILWRCALRAMGLSLVSRGFKVSNHKTLGL